MINVPTILPSQPSNNIYIYVSILKCTYVITSVTFQTCFVGAVTFLNQMELDSAAKKVMLNYVGNSKCACYYYYMYDFGAGVDHPHTVLCMCKVNLVSTKFVPPPMNKYDM